MKYYMGIDGGGTSTIACIADGNGNIIETIKLGTTNYHIVGVEKVKETLEKLINVLTKVCNITLCQVSGICMGGSGIDSLKCKETVENIFREIGYTNKLYIYNDSVVALVAANGGYSGGVVISGTGSVGLVVDRNNDIQKVGGWGHILDDNGGGYAIGRDALSMIMKTYDGRENESLLWEKVSEELNIENQEEIIEFVYKDKIPKKDIAGLAPIVINLYNKDILAKNIIDSAIKSLEIIIETLIKKSQKENVSIGLYGSVIIKSELIRDKLIKNIRKNYPKVEIHLPYKDAYIGALDIALGKVSIKD